MKKSKKLSKISFILGILFLISYLIGKVSLNLILACTWICISITYKIMDKENKSK